MLRHILVPTDGSDISQHAAERAVELARMSGGRITAFHVAPAYKEHVPEESVVPPDFVTPDEYAKRAAHDAEPYLVEVKKRAEVAGVPCETHHDTNDYPAEAILAAAERYGCDTIVMGTHGRQGIRKMLLGSVAQKVLQDATVPVLVTR